MSKESYGADEDEARTRTRRRQGDWDVCRLEDAGQRAKSECGAGEVLLAAEAQQNKAERKSGRVSMTVSL